MSTSKDNDQIFFTTDTSLNLLDGFSMNDTNISIMFSENDSFMDLSGNGILLGGGFVEANRISGYSTVGEWNIVVDTSSFTLENISFAEDSIVHLHIPDGGDLTISCCDFLSNSRLIVSGNLQDINVIGTIFESGAFISAPDCDADTCSDFVACAAEDVEQPLFFGEEEANEKQVSEHQSDGWALPLVSLAVAGIMGIFKPKKTKLVQEKQQKVEVGEAWQKK